MAEKFRPEIPETKQELPLETIEKIKKIWSDLGIRKTLNLLRAEMDTYSAEEQKNMGNTLLMQIMMAGGEFSELSEYKKEFNKPIDYESKVTNLINKLYEEAKKDGDDKPLEKAA